MMRAGGKRTKPPQMLKNMIDNGMLGEKSGQGFYSWPDPVFMQEGFLKS